MSRELKFRAWNNTEGWIDTEFCIHADGHVYQDARKVYNTPHLEIETAYDDLIIEQFTGLKDSSGVDIYEGDIVTEIAEIPYFPVSFFNGDYWLGEERLSAVNIDSVIGNIHENNELL